MVAAVPGQSAERRDPPDLERAETVEKGHGRIETRRIQVRTRLPARLDQDWPGVGAICRIERIRELKDRCSCEVVYAITSCHPGKHNAVALLKLLPPFPNPAQKAPRCSHIHRLPPSARGRCGVPEIRLALGQPDWDPPFVNAS